MANLYRLNTEWTGFSGAPGTTTLYFNATPSPTGVKAFWTAIKAYVPSVVNWTIKGSGDIINDVNGQLTGGWSSGSDLTEVGGGASASYAAPSGIVVRLTTSTIVNGHRVKGRIFIVPINGSFWAADGTPATANLAAIQTAATALVSAYSGSLAVWARPFEGREATATKPAIPRRDGSTAIVTGATAVDSAAVLRSRRD